MIQYDQEHAYTSQWQAVGQESYTDICETLNVYLSRLQRSSNPTVQKHSELIWESNRGWGPAMGFAPSYEEEVKQAHLLWGEKTQ